MKLFYSRSNPYARKVRACAIALGIETQIALIEVDVADPPDTFLAANPLGRLPTLLTEDGFAIFDSPVICEYLNGVAGTLPIVPAGGAARWLCLRSQALGDGLMDACVPLRHLLQPGVAADHKLVERYTRSIDRTLAYLEREKLARHVDVGTLSIACALGYVGFRFPERDWRAAHPQLAGWHDAMSQHPCLSQTAPS